MRLSARLEALRRRSVLRVVRKEYKDYRWWSYQDDEPPEGYVLDVVEYREHVYPPPIKVHAPSKFRLSRTKLKARLYAAGIRNPNAAELAHVIFKVAIPAGLPSTGMKCIVLGWPEESLEALLGKRVFKLVTRGIPRMYFVMDEMGFYVPPTLQVFYGSCRKLGTEMHASPDSPPEKYPYTQDQGTSALALQPREETHASS